jgi:hypothetical protein
MIVFRRIASHMTSRRPDSVSSDHCFPITLTAGLGVIRMAKWNWLQGLRCCLAGAGIVLVSSVAVAGDATSIPDSAIANPDKIFQQTSYKLLDASCEAPAAKCGTCGSKDKDNAGCKSNGCDGGLAEELGMGCWNCSAEPWQLLGTTDQGVELGGWAQFGYSSEPTGLFTSPGEEDKLNLNQLWFYMEKSAAGECGEWDWGFRVDALYGTDADDTQAFGNSPGSWDFANGFDHGIYGFAIPQAYAELDNGDWNVKLGHFFSPIGYETVAAPGNFFFSHSFTRKNSEPFTHTGVLATKNVDDDTTVYGGWTLGWDTGFDQTNSGSNFLGGITTAVSDNVTFSYMTTIGDFGVREEGYSHSLVFDVCVSDDLNYVMQSDLVSTNDDPSGANDQFGINQYLIYQVNDCVAAGTRLEWWKSDGVSTYGATFGVNVRPHSNIVIRPEVRHQWTPAGTLATGNQDETIFGVDAIFSF